ncbi:MAG TPA: ABC transporter permease [Candidatus Thermoplasmatota archaeon]|nr:ABC transporter permease [Candidatus Thermoplasmatota archaeon]
MTTAIGKPVRARLRVGETTAKTVWTILVWTLFGLLILGPLLTVVAFSFTPNVFDGVRPTTLQHYAKLFSDAQLYGPLLRSFEVALVVVLIQLVFGTLVAYATVRGRIFGARTLDSLSNITIALPSVVVGLALLAFYGPYGPVSAAADTIFGSPFTLTWTLAILVFAHVLETFPYMVRSVTAGLQRMDPHLESAARSLGAGKWHVFRTITLPQLRPSLVAGSVLVLSRSIAEFGATIIVVSAILRTAPVKIYSEAESGSLEVAAAYSVILMLVSFAAYVAMTRWLLREEMGRAIV